MYGDSKENTKARAREKREGAQGQGRGNRRMIRDIGRLIIAFVLGAAFVRQSPTSAAPAEASPKRPPMPLQNEGQVQEEAEAFAYLVLDNAAQRSVATVRFFDALLLGLIAAQIAILAIYVERAGTHEAFAAGLVRPMIVALYLALGGLLSTIATKDGPSARYFAKNFPRDPAATRTAVMKLFERIETHNDLIRTFKILAFLGSLGLTVWDVVAATAVTVSSVK
jgi:hypothetical protein